MEQVAPVGEGETVGFALVEVGLAEVFEAVGDVVGVVLLEEQLAIAPAPNKTAGIKTSGFELIRTGLPFWGKLIRAD